MLSGRSDLMEEVGSNGVVWSGWRDARNTLRRWREENSRKSDLVVELGLPLLKNHSSALGDEGEMRSDNRVTSSSSSTAMFCSVGRS